MIYVYSFVIAAAVLFVAALIAMRGADRTREQADMARLTVPLAPSREDLAGAPRHGCDDTAVDIGHIPRHHARPSIAPPLRPVDTIGDRARRGLKIATQEVRIVVHGPGELTDVFADGTRGYAIGNPAPLERRAA